MTESRAPYQAQIVVDGHLNRPALRAYEDPALAAITRRSKALAIVARVLNRVLARVAAAHHLDRVEVAKLLLELAERQLNREIEARVMVRVEKALEEKEKKR